MKLDGKMILWPANLDSTKSRSEGRKISKSSAVQNPRLDELNEAANRLGIKAETGPGKSRPSSWWEKNGYLIVPRRDSKTATFRSLAGEVRRIRSMKDSGEKA